MMGFAKRRSTHPTFSALILLKILGLVAVMLCLSLSLKYKIKLAFKDDWSYYSYMASTNKHIKRERLLDQGVKMLMEQGYHGTGLKEMLDTVGVPKGSFYNYFASKEAFAAQAISHYIEPFLQRLSGHLQNPQLDGLAALRLYYSELIIEVDKSDYSSGCLLGNLMGEIGGSSVACHQALKIAIERYRSLQESALLRAQQEGVVRTDRTAECMSDLLVNNWQGALLRMKIDQSIAPLEEFRATLLDDYFKA